MAQFSTNPNVVRTVITFEEDFDTYMDVVIDATVKQLADENGVSEGIIKSVLEEQLDMSFKDYIKSNPNEYLDTFIDFFLNRPKYAEKYLNMLISEYTS